MTNGESEPSGAMPVGYYALRLLDEISSWLAAFGTQPPFDPCNSLLESSHRILHSRIYFGHPLADADDVQLPTLRDDQHSGNPPTTR
jgi:hypothetical protein